MKTIHVELSGDDTPLPAGKIFGEYVYVLTAKDTTAPLASVRTADTFAKFENVADGTYTVTVSTLAADGSALAPSVAGEVAVGQSPTATFLAPTGLGFLVA